MQGRRVTARFDHAVVIVPSLKRAVQSFERLGFRVVLGGRTPPIGQISVNSYPLRRCHLAGYTETQLEIPHKVVRGVGPVAAIKTRLIAASLIQC